jgi:hypothetical protein
MNSTATPLIYQFLTYYGSFPNYFQLYLDSVSINTDILRIILITDIDTSSYKIPHNVLIFNCCIDAVKKALSNFLEKEYGIVNIESQLLKRPYKLCECKPIYHILFEDIVQTLKIKDTDYIGWGDCDLIYGKLSSFIDLSKDYDLIGSKGHFTAFKNKDICRSFYKSIPKYSDYLIDNEYHYSDENELHKVIIPLISDKKITYHEMAKHFFDILPHNCFGKENEFQELTLAGSRTVLLHVEFNKSKQTLCGFFNNKSIRNASYIHLQKRRMLISFDSYDESYFITSSQFVKSV